jgi:DtxR family Mn-dependent transcriptional regulator
MLQNLIKNSNGMGMDKTIESARARAEEVCASQDESVDEILELLWTLREDKNNNLYTLIERSHEKNKELLIESMQECNLIQVNDSRVDFTEDGEKRGRGIIRRHRLAERLFFDVFQLSEELFEIPACKFEHVLEPEVTDSICAFLGHPPVCPHNKPIPKGDCCNKFKKTLAPLVQRLKDAEIGKGMRIVFIAPRFGVRLDRLSTLGINPGETVKLKQKQPSFVVEVGETTIAIDSQIAEDIYVKEAI